MLRLLLLASLALSAQDLAFSPSGDLVRPNNYREWVFLSSGLGMTYGPAAEMSKSPKFDTVFVSPQAWKAFKETGKWPEKTVFILEIRASSSKGSINQAGYFPTGVDAIEAAVKDTARFPGGWGYFDFASTGNGEHALSAKLLDQKASCYACHRANAAVENTFVQFYPTALEIAKRKGTLNAGYEPGTHAK